MDENIIRASVYHYARQYLTGPHPQLEPRNIEGACVSVARVHVPGWPVDVRAYRLLVEQLDAGWSAAIHVGLRSDQPWRAQVDQTWDDTGNHGGPAGAHEALVDWLRSL
ncbi:hypothetical protein MMSR116_18385 [Methylobacterium mesophilicum SR1.6/6]|uniref:Uncharacterized protein n=1 Tax=Methylobacterium mesophilicum SR1.6/6 TaxID=908290 RepID=A0A6B9FP45_9HYPH|nr:hypothetical protein [Methylobacterium mesophilicum]QGY03639.1 hypothetical protein MMSR116_18385 [Methylobacterium mesophilicum SR1.6/6]